MDEPLLRRARRRSVIQTAVAVGLLVLLVGAAMFAITVRAQSRAVDRQLGQVVAAAEDVDDPPPGDLLARRGPTGRVQTTPRAPAAVAAVLDSAVRAEPRRFTTVAGGVPLRILVAGRPDGTRWAAAADLRPVHRQRGGLLAALLLAEIAGVGGAVAVAVLLSRRAVAPLALALAEQRRFVADASHELRTPLTVLQTRVQLVARRARERPAEPLAGQLDELVADTRALGEVVTDLLVSAEVEQHRETGRPVDLAVVAGGVVDSATAYARERDVRLSLEVAGEGLIVRGAEPALRRALLALVDNAVGHVGPGGQVDVRVTGDGRSVSATVADDGVGLDPTDTERLFARFAHGTDGAGRRFGLGLALVRHVAEAHGGSVRISGAPGQGATFTLVFPAG
ncbi:sensor histidine kinase [Plantactinospora siamensis]|uniref:histidine kinase n=1 Tax=Plantactinospora siamensis TaxID=555372 RepID=A0ABV6P1E0_9ACTN